MAYFSCNYSINIITLKKKSFSFFSTTQFAIGIKKWREREERLALPGSFLWGVKPLFAKTHVSLRTLTQLEPMNYFNAVCAARERQRRERERHMQIHACMTSSFPLFLSHFQKKTFFKSSRAYSSFFVWNFKERAHSQEGNQSATILYTHVYTVARQCWRAINQLPKYI